MKAVVAQPWLQGAILLIIGAATLWAAACHNWALVGTSLTGLFAALNLSRRETPPPQPDDDSTPAAPPKGAAEPAS